MSIEKIVDLKKRIENAFWKSGNGYITYAFEEVAVILMEIEERIEKLEKKLEERK